MATEYTDLSTDTPPSAPQWWQITLAATDHPPEDLEEALFHAGALSVTFEDAADDPVWEPAPGQTPLWARTHVTGLFDIGTDRDAVRAALCQWLETDILPEYHVSTLAERDWVRAWRDHFQPMRFGQRVWICPSGHTPPDPSAVNIHLDPGLAFGTGTHPSTALCLTWLDGADLIDKTVLDYGCGSGILAIAAARLGAVSVFAVDIDPQAVLATRDNREKNVVDDKKSLVDERFSTGLPEDLPKTLRVDVVLANILANILILLAPELTRYVRPGGKLVLSGVLERQADAVQAAFAQKFHFEPRRECEGWSLLVGEKRHDVGDL